MAADQRPPRKRVWVPRANVNSDEMLPNGGPPEAEPESGAAEATAPDTAVHEQAVRQQSGDEFLGIFDDDPDEETVEWVLGSEFLETAEEIAERTSNAIAEDGIRHVVFETNHPELDVSDGDTDEPVVIHQIARFTRQYANCWGIENGYKKTKSFMAETTSKDHSYRFFNFILACFGVLAVADRRRAGETLAR